MRPLWDMLVESYHKDKIAFYFENISLVVTIITSMYLAMNADAPNMKVVYPGYMVGAIAAIYAYWRRRIPTPLLLTSYFAIINVYGYGVASYWW